MGKGREGKFRKAPRAPAMAYGAPKPNQSEDPHMLLYFEFPLRMFDKRSAYPFDALLTRKLR